MPSVKVLPSFTAKLRLLSEGRRKYIVGRVRRFVANSQDKLLRFRPLRCAPGHFLIDSVRGDRIVLRQEAEDAYALVDCGGHDIIDEWERLAAEAPQQPQETATKH